MKYENKKTGKVGDLIRSEKGLVNLNVEGKMVQVTESTFKRWWKKVEESEPQEQKETKKAEKKIQPMKIQSIKGSEEVVKKEKPEIPKRVEEKTEKKSVTNKKLVWTAEYADSVFEECKNQLESIKAISILTYEKLPRLMVLKVGKKTVFEVRINRAGVSINCRPEDVPDGVEHYVINNYYLVAVIKDNDSYMEIIQNLCDNVIKKYNIKEEN